MISVSPNTDGGDLLLRVVELEDALTVAEHAEDLNLPVKRVQALAAELARRGLLAPRLYRLSRHAIRRLAAGGEPPRESVGPAPAAAILDTLRAAALDRDGLASAVGGLTEAGDPTGAFKAAVTWLSDTAGTLSTPLDLWPSAEGIALVQSQRSAA